MLGNAVFQRPVKLLIKLPSTAYLLDLVLL